MCRCPAIRRLLLSVTEMIDDAKARRHCGRTKMGGGELVKLMGTSAWYAQRRGYSNGGAYRVLMKTAFPLLRAPQWEYGMKGIFLGVPGKTGLRGIEQMLELKLNSDEMNLL